MLLPRVAWPAPHLRRLWPLTWRAVRQVVMVLKKEIVKTQNKDFEKGGEYRQMLVQAIHSCAVKFPDVAAQVVRDAGGGG